MPTSFTRAVHSGWPLPSWTVERLDFLSFFPRMEFVSLWENILVPVMVAGLAEVVTPGINDPQSAEAMGAGDFLTREKRGLPSDRRVRADQA